MPFAVVAAIVAALVAVNAQGPETTSPERGTGKGATPSNPYDESFGTFAPVTITGSGTATVSLPASLPAEARGGIIAIDYRGSDLFEVAVENGPSLLRNSFGGLEVGSLSRRGPYSGTVLFGDSFVPGERTSPLAADETWSLSVRSSSGGKGSWEVTIAPISSAEELHATASGRGDDVFLYNGDFAQLHFWHRPPGGMDSFAMLQWGLDRLDGAMPRASGSYVYPGPAVVAVSSSGHWNATLE